MNKPKIVKRVIDRLFRKKNEDKAWNEFVDMGVEAYMEQHNIQTQEQPIIDAVRALIIGKIYISEQSEMVAEMIKVDTDLEETIMAMIGHNVIPKTMPEMEQMKEWEGLNQRERRCALRIRTKES